MATRKRKQLRVAAILLIVGACVVAATSYQRFHRAALIEWPRDAVAERVFAEYRGEGDYRVLSIRHPLHGAVFPADIAAPTFGWDDAASGADAWAIGIQFRGFHRAIGIITHEPQWVPSEALWEAMKRRSTSEPARVTILGIKRADPARILSAGSVVFSSSCDPVGAPIFYREVNLPFIEAVKYPWKIRWRFGSVASREQPPVVLEGLPVCGNCHSFSADGGVLGMDVDYANDKGSYAIAPVAPSIVLDREKIITWSDYRRDDGDSTFGLLSQVSPDGRFVASTVKDRSVFVPRPDLAFSQLFFPVKGILAVYSRATGSIAELPGANDRRYVQSNPAWSPDGHWLVFARSRALTLEKVKHNRALLAAEECREFLDDAKPFRFDLYRMPFNGGLGGRPEPLRGASGNGMSNFFPKHSPDGRWIVFCRARNYMLLQPDSALYIIPAQGGEARRLDCNLPGMNSWHSWSPNGRWLVFSSKANGPYTQLFLAHMDSAGNSSPPVLLDWFTAADRAANIPEFVNAPPDAIQAITERFVEDDLFARIGDERLKASDFQGAASAYREATRRNPQNADALAKLGAALIGLERFDEARPHLARAAELRPNDPVTLRCLGDALSRLRRTEEAIAAYRRTLELDPRYTRARLSLATLLTGAGRLDDAAAELAEAARFEPDDAFVQLRLARALARQKKHGAALAAYRRAVELEPNCPDALVGLARILATCDDPALRNGAEAVEHALRACGLTAHRAPEALDILAAAQAEAGARDEAIATARKALALAQEGNKHALARDIAARLQLYLDSEPIRSGQ